MVSSRPEADTIGCKDVQPVVLSLEILATGAVASWQWIPVYGKGSMPVLMCNILEWLDFLSLGSLIPAAVGATFAWCTTKKKAIFPVIFRCYAVL